jgi:hypothetical protein
VKPAQIRAGGERGPVGLLVQALNEKIDERAEPILRGDAHCFNDVLHPQAAPDCVCAFRLSE